MRRVPSSLVGVMFVSACWLGCDASGSTLAVDVQTDLTPALSLASLELEVLGGSGEIVAHVGPVAPPSDVESLRRGSYRMASLRSLPAGTFVVHVVGRSPAESPGLPLNAGPLLVERRVAVLMNAGTTRVVRVVLGARCAGATAACPEADAPDRTECLNGVCVRPSCDTTPDGPGCDDPDATCLEPADCSVGAECATTLCIDGACIGVESPGGCSASEFCGPDGCEPLPDTMRADAGPLDASITTDDASADDPDTGARDAGAQDAALVEDAYFAIPDASGPCGMIDSACDDGNECTMNDRCTASGCVGTNRTSGSCGPATTCRSDYCSAGRCVRRNAGGPTCPADGDPCTQNVCLGGACYPPAADGTACDDGDTNDCTAGACIAGSCVILPVENGAICDGLGICCGAICRNWLTDGANCGACGVSCGGRGCEAGLCRCSTNAQCTAELDSAASCWDSTLTTDPAGSHCQCQCPGGTLCNGGCPGTSQCVERSGYNRCEYPR